MIENGMVMPTNVNFNRARQRRVVFYGRVSTEHEAQLSALENQMQWYFRRLWGSKKDILNDVSSVFISNRYAEGLFFRYGTCRSSDKVGHCSNL